MALLTIVDADGKPHLIHSSQIGPQSRRPKSTGWWSDVWPKFDMLLSQGAAPAVVGEGASDYDRP